ncbi:catechol 2,3-dioxygenase-like lactoylglutathione lyase family enzyme [Rhizobium sp. PP-F2F-G48]|uniref:VOC family protein n=1 Tax=Rhizobium sp. PP-F2F-G48 TaxID=2135651 RepID=UPI00104C33CE|nr:VOC family protein [Rhizobium sp. PP-F2F-G48]TCM57528.1 catechol 2,3-dioxygenase-like lactoylglutathione lyase family enzyme [Rhizobium sp. PP-F2F-G48]
MLDHIGFPVGDFARAAAFYDAALAPLGITRQMAVTVEMTGKASHLGYGTPGSLFFWISSGEAISGSLHVAFAAESRERVDAFYAAAIAAGGRDNGAPGLRPHYHEHYYGAFVLDPDGHNIEAVCHAAV